MIGTAFHRLQGDSTLPPAGVNEWYICSSGTAGIDPLLSPEFGGLLTPEWAKRDRSQPAATGKAALTYVFPRDVGHRWCTVQAHTGPAVVLAIGCYG